MMEYAVCVALVLLCGSSTEAVTVDVYYETLCEDSVNFIQYQLVPTYRSLKNYMNIRFIPYGKASHSLQSDGTWAFQCQHGPEECRENKAHACTLYEIGRLRADDKTKENVAVDFVGCAMNRRNSPRPASLCAQYLGLGSTENCVNSALGSSLLASHGQRTQTSLNYLSFVPTIVINEIYTSAYQNAALRNLKNLVCSHIPGTKPAACQYY